MVEDGVEFEEWMRYGISKGWCGAPVCYTHDGMPMSLDEDDQFGDGGDPCIHIVRMYENEEDREAIEEAHAPSQWRNHYTK